MNLEQKINHPSTTLVKLEGIYLKQVVRDANGQVLKDVEVETLFTIRTDILVPVLESLKTKKNFVDGKFVKLEKFNDKSTHKALAILPNNSEICQ